MSSVTLDEDASALDDEDESVEAEDGGKESVGTSRAERYVSSRETVFILASCGVWDGRRLGDGCERESSGHSAAWPDRGGRCASKTGHETEREKDVSPE